jgi:hypothetical protein
MSMIPETYEQWRRCIEVDCGLVLSPDYIAERVRELSDAQHERSRQYVRLYGDAHRLRVIGWFQRAATTG